MNPKYTIQQLHRTEIDESKWNDCVINASNGLIYHTTQYLDGVCDEWDALVTPGYTAIMPLPKRKKLGIPYLYQPTGLAQGGIISSLPVSIKTEQAFLQQILQHYKYGTIHLNEGFATENFSGTTITTKVNYVLALHLNYEHLFSNYSKDGKKNINKLVAGSQTLFYNSNPDDTLLLYKQQYLAKVKKHEKELDRFLILLKQLIQNKNAFCICSKSTEGQLLASAIFGNFKNRLYYLLGAPSHAGRNTGGMHFIIDQVIRQYAGTGYLLDFEGSSIISVADFYKKFGSTNRPYKTMHFNNLPAPLKWVKK